MPRYDLRIIGQRQYLRVQRVHDLLHRPARQVRASDAAGKERVPGDQLLLFRKIDADAAFRVPGCMNHVGGYFPNLQHAACADRLIYLDRPWRLHAHPRCLNVQHLQQSVVILVHQDGRARGRFELHGPAHVVNVCVCYHNLLQDKVLAAQDVEDVFHFIAGIDDHGFMRLLVADDRAVTLQRTNRKYFMDHSKVVTYKIEHAFRSDLKYLGLRRRGFGHGAHLL